MGAGMCTAEDAAPAHRGRADLAAACPRPAGWPRPDPMGHPRRPRDPPERRDAAAPGPPRGRAGEGPLAGMDWPSLLPDPLSTATSPGALGRARPGEADTKGPRVTHLVPRVRGPGGGGRRSCSAASEAPSAEVRGRQEERSGLGSVAARRRGPRCRHSGGTKIRKLGEEWGSQNTLSAAIETEPGRAASDQIRAPGIWAPCPGAWGPCVKAEGLSKPASHRAKGLCLRVPDLLD
ncbi:unnamed protein product [Rangifer tarandus platyrhynchus]|uniref:Uncharacterized protein n=2 Tax=Rangifer tarandus platyrhynchus TaxID=3082113 RepID=A0ABN8ZMM4_RANTA|nr:unnamed protein product [Rangifer tarandus platyrhynchus]CAI9706783.1 unnamed protein product [Rangifer tarandus platyrhynchus]